MNERRETSAAVDRATEINEKHDRYLWDAVIRYYEPPLPLAKGRGHLLYDFEGNQYLDFFAGILTVSVGHCHPTVTKAIQEQAETLVHSSTLYPTAPIVDLDGHFVNVGFSPGDAAIHEPYVYVAPHDTSGLDADYWNVAFGAVLQHADLRQAADTDHATMTFIDTGLRLVEARRVIRTAGAPGDR